MARRGPSDRKCITGRSTLIDVAFAVCTALEACGTRAVLTGGTAATFYAPEAYQSRDADFVLTMNGDPKGAAQALERLGFTERGGIHSHPDTAYTLDFPPGPLSVGSELIASYHTAKRDDQVLHVLTRTDSVRDRLSASYHWNDRSSLRTAIAVARSGPVEIEVIEAWSVREGAHEKLGEFQATLARDRGVELA